MTEKKLYMRGEEFILKIRSGERNFSGLELEERFDLSGHEGFAEMQTYLTTNAVDLKRNPVTLNCSRWRYLKAKNVFLPFLQGREASLFGADLEGARLEGARFVGADLGGAYLVGARLEGADLVGADLGGANLMGADLERAHGLENAIYNNTRVTRDQEALIEAKLTKRNLFIVEG